MTPAPPDGSNRNDDLGLVLDLDEEPVLDNHRHRQRHRDGPSNGDPSDGSGEWIHPPSLTPELLEYHLESAIPERISLLASAAAAEKAIGTDDTERAMEISTKIRRMRMLLSSMQRYDDDDSDLDPLSTCSCKPFPVTGHHPIGKYHNSIGSSKCIILILDPASKSFDFVPVNYQPDVSTVHDLLSQIPERASRSSDFALRFQSYQGLAVMKDTGGKEELIGGGGKNGGTLKQKVRGSSHQRGGHPPCHRLGDNATPSSAASRHQTTAVVVPRRHSLDYHVEQEAPLVAVPETFTVRHTLALARMLMKRPKVQRSFQEMQESILSGLELF
jgi:hypothetical protein